MGSKKTNKSKRLEKNISSDSRSMLSWMLGQFEESAKTGRTTESGTFAKMALDYLYLSGWKQASMDVVSLAYQLFEEMERNGDKQAAAVALEKLKKDIERERAK